MKNILENLTPFLILSAVSVPPVLSVTNNIDHPLYSEVVTIDYKVHVDAGKEDCYYQEARKGGLLYIDFNVISGGDGKTGFRVMDPMGQNVMTEDWKAGGSYETSEALPGYYAACIDNSISIFSSKLVNFYFHTYMEEYAEDLKPEELEMEIGLNNLTTILSGAGSRINKMAQYLHQSRSDESRDFALLEQNNYYVVFWSAVQCVVIILTGSLHVYFVRKLFETPGGGASKHLKYTARL